MANTQTPTTLAEGRFNGEFIVSEAPGHRSRGKGNFLDQAPGADMKFRLEAGTILEASGSDWVPLANLDPVGKTLAISFNTQEIPNGTDWEINVFLRDGEVNDHDLIFPAGMTDPHKATARAQLAASNIHVRMTRETN